MSNRKKIVIVGGCGHVGLPLGLALASRNCEVLLMDVNKRSVDLINRGTLPFLEQGADVLLRENLGTRLSATTDANCIKNADVVFFVTGTPVDEHHNPRVQDVLNVIESYVSYLRSDTLVVLRSTLYPGVIAIIDRILEARLGKHKLAFCPERIVQGKGIEEIFKLPQIVSATSPSAEREAAELFAAVAPKIILLSPIEAELAKLMTNSWRYLEFAIANQFYMIAESQGIDFYRVFNALRDGYDRASHFASPGLAAGPCLFKDTMQMASFHKNNFFLGHAAMLINEGLPDFLVSQLEKQLISLVGKRVAILGMTFKANNDDTRESLSFKLKKVLEMRQSIVICCDPYLPDLTPIDEAVAEADGIILGVPHREFLSLRISKPFVDCWGLWRAALTSDCL